jgi:hypothetical protein
MVAQRPEREQRPQRAQVPRRDVQTLERCGDTPRSVAIVTRRQPADLLSTLMQRAHVVALTYILALAGAIVACAPAPPRFPARPPGCALETFKVLPQRPFIELETFNLHSPESLQDVLDTVRDRACRDGADAIYVPKTGKVYSYAIALTWKDALRPAPVPAE